MPRPWPGVWPRSSTASRALTRICRLPEWFLTALEGMPGVTILGGLPHNERIAIPERHLGLVTQEEHSLTPERIAHLASFIEDNLDLAQMLHISKVHSLKAKAQSL